MLIYYVGQLGNLFSFSEDGDYSDWDFMQLLHVKGAFRVNATSN